MELKLVVNIKDERAVIGVQSPTRDPYFTTATGDFKTVLAATEEAIAAAKEKWKTAPKNPAITIPQPAAKEAPAAKSKDSKKGSGARPLPPPPAKNTVQPPMF